MDVFELFVYKGLYLWMFFQFPLSLKLFRWSPTADGEREEGCELQRYFFMETCEADKMLIHGYCEEGESQDVLMP